MCLVWHLLLLIFFSPSFKKKKKLILSFLYLPLNILLVRIVHILCYSVILSFSNVAVLKNPARDKIGKTRASNRKATSHPLISKEPSLAEKQRFLKIRDEQKCLSVSLFGASFFSLPERSGPSNYKGSSDAVLTFRDRLKGLDSRTSLFMCMIVRGERMDHDETGFQAPPERPILCINNCGFFGSVATMNMCSKCYKDTIMKQEQAKLAASSIGSIVNESSNSNGIEPVAAATVDVQMQVSPVEPKIICAQPSCASGSEESVEAKPKEGPNRCSSCKKRVGLTGFTCRCGNLFCSSHRYSDKHDCAFDYRTAARDAIAKANPVIKAEKIDKI